MPKLRFLMVALLLPAAGHANSLFCWGKCQEAKEAYAYFDKLCREKAFTRIYKHVKDVDSILRVNGEAARLHRDPERDINAPNAYGLARDDGDYIFGLSKGLFKTADVVEVPFRENGVVKYRRYPKERADGYYSGYVVVDKSDSRYAYQWSDVTTEDMRKYWIAGSHYKFFDRVNGILLAEHRGYTIGIEDGGRVNKLMWSFVMPSCDRPFRYDDGRQRDFTVWKMWDEIEQGE